MSDSPFSTDRRDFLTGKSAVERVRNAVHTESGRLPPSSGHTVRLSQRAMACDFSVITNAGVPKSFVEIASGALDLVAELEQQLSVYREDSELTQLNRRAFQEAVTVEERLFELLVEAKRISLSTERAFDPTSGPLVTLWRDCRDQLRIPTQQEIELTLERVGIQHVQLDTDDLSIRFDRAGLQLNLGGIGKGYALDRSARQLATNGVDSWLLHGGHSSLLACGDHNGLRGWPVGIGNPLITGKRLGTIVLTDCAMATSGSNIQYFRHQGKKYGHILDPRTGWPIETVLSVTVLAPTAAMADALSTAFYVMGVEKVAECCDNLDGVSAIVIPLPSGRQLRPMVFGIPDDKLFLDGEQIAS